MTLKTSMVTQDLKNNFKVTMMLSSSQEGQTHLQTGWISGLEMVMTLLPSVADSLFKEVGAAEVTIHSICLMISEMINIMEDLATIHSYPLLRIKPLTTQLLA